MDLNWSISMHSRINIKSETLIMRLNIKKLEAKGFTVYADKDSIEIHSAPMSDSAYRSIKAVVIEQAGIIDPGLQDYAIGNFLVALQRAQILELTE